MVPIRDTIHTENHPFITIAVILLNGMIFVVETTLGPEIDHIFAWYGLVPARYSIPEISAYFTWDQQALAFLSFMFLHGDFWHLLGNMWPLYIFGSKVEDRLGPVKYLGFYLLCGIVSALTHLLLNWKSSSPTIGASAPVSGIMGAYLMLYPRSKILTLIPLVFVPIFVELSAVFFICLWFILQLINVDLAPSDVGDIAWCAHIGGFIFGFLFVRSFLNIPDVPISEKVKNLSLKRKSPHLEVVRIESRVPGPNLYGFLTITDREARKGTHKLIAIPTDGVKKRLSRIAIPGGISDGNTFRFRGLGRQEGKVRGDLHIRFNIAKDDSETTGG